MPDYFSDLESKDQAKGGDGKDYFSDLEAKDKPRENPFAGAVSALGKAGRAAGRELEKSNTGTALANIPFGIANPFEQVTNLQQKANNMLPPGMGDALANAGSMGLPAMNLLRGQQPLIDLANKVSGAPPQPYMDMTRQMQKWQPFGNQTLGQMNQQNPLGAMIGQNLPLAALPGGVAKNLPQAMGMGAGLSGAFGGLENLNDQIKTNDTVDPGQLMGSVGQNALFGAGLSGALHGLGKFFAPKAAGPTAPPPVEPQQIGYNNQTAIGQRPTTPMGMRKLLGYTPPNAALEGSHPGQYVQTAVQGRVLPTASETPPPGKTVKIGYDDKPTKEAKIEVNVTPPDPHTPAKQEKIEKKVESMSFFDPDESWRAARDNNARPATAQEAPLARKFARLRTELDAAAAPLKGAIAKFYKELGEQAPQHRRQLDPSKAAELTKYAKELGGTPKKNVAQLDSAMAVKSKFPEAYDFKSTTLEGKMKEIEKLHAEWQARRTIYDGWKTRNEEAVNETFPLNQTIQIGIKTQEHGDRVINMRRVWRPSEYEFAPADEPKYQAKIEELQKQSQLYPDFNFPAFKAVMNAVANSGKNIKVEGLADSGALNWLQRLPKGTQAKIMLAIGLTAAAYLHDDDPAEAAPTAAIATRVAKKTLIQLFKQGWVEALGSRPITRIFQLELTTDMINNAPDAAGKAFANVRAKYMSDLKRANVGFREMTEEEHEATKDLEPWQIRRPWTIPGTNRWKTLAANNKWTKVETAKAGDLIQLNAEYKAAIRAERKRLESLKIAPGHIGTAARYARGVDIDASDMGVDVGYKPLGPSAEAVHMLTGEVMKSTFLGNARVAVLHMHEMLMVTASKNPAALAVALHGLAKSKTYRDFAIANSPKGFFQQMLEEEKKYGGLLGIRQKIGHMINDPIDHLIKRVIGDVGYEAVSMQLGERGKLGLNGLVQAIANAKDYPGGPETYMKDWLDNANERKPVPPQRELEFAKTALNIQMEEYKNTGNLPEGPIKERTVFQRTEAFTIVIAYTRGKIQQSRFLASLLDDALQAAGRGDKTALAKALGAFLTANIVIFAAAGSAAVPAFIWGILEGLDRLFQGTNDDIDNLKNILDQGQKNVGPGYQMRELGPSGFAETNLPTGAAMGYYGQVIRDMHPKTRMDIAKAVADTVTMLFTSKIGPTGNANTMYILERIRRGVEGSEKFSTWIKDMPGALAAGWAQKPLMTGSKKLPYNFGTAALQSLSPTQTPDEIEQIQKGERQAGKDYQKNIKAVGKMYQKAAKK